MKEKERGREKERKRETEREREKCRFVWEVANIIYSAVTP